MSTRVEKISADESDAAAFPAVHLTRPSLPRVGLETALASDAGQRLSRIPELLKPILHRALDDFTGFEDWPERTRLLYRLCLTSQQWLVIAQAELFDTILLDDSSLPLFRATLEAHKHLRALPETLRVVNSSNRHRHEDVRVILSYCKLLAVRFRLWSPIVFPEREMQSSELARLQLTVCNPDFLPLVLRALPHLVALTLYDGMPGYTDQSESAFDAEAAGAFPIYAMLKVLELYFAHGRHKPLVTWLLTTFQPSLSCVEYYAGEFATTWPASLLDRKLHSFRYTIARYPSSADFYATDQLFDDLLTVLPRYLYRLELHFLHLDGAYTDTRDHLVSIVEMLQEDLGRPMVRELRIIVAAPEGDRAMWREHWRALQRRSPFFGIKLAVEPLGVDHHAQGCLLNCDQVLGDPWP